MNDFNCSCVPGYTGKKCSIGKPIHHVIELSPHSFRSIIYLIKISTIVLMDHAKMEEVAQML